ncbi:outer membrane beta-barrel protein [Tamlana sp. 2201CG12-4]|uniref:outer membrane beta-barrel protein n=1 Tax=Tamlana sp. 2201CG12-4 TaxID=3112582 RepID=UPI002DC03B7F|nr:outer membrane beta-barrel protein [Tamlana sp. 2201CG12-4]MEC3906733.1 outer membrane beta-barrel protein [Tamlana sp. 2201CG12-4]
MKNYLFGLMLLCTMFSFSQSKQFTISGTLISDDNNAPLESATAYLERVKDSSLVSYTITDKDGSFELTDKTSDSELKLLISYVGYEAYTKTIKIDKPVVNLGTVNLKVDSNALDAVIIESSPPIIVKKDTLEFNVKSFKTKKDANVEDVLRLLPGVEVDEEGNITINGQSVSRILVNGKPFFGNDPTITTRNLTKDVIEKIQVVDTKTKAQAFAGEASDSENKTINLTIKKENNKGVFGRLAAGAGTDETYEYAGMFNRFDNDQRLSVLAGGNNINSPGFSFGEIRKMFGGGGNSNIGSRAFGGGQGIVTSNNIGLNYADELGKKVDLSTDYFYSGSSSENETSTQRENILPDSRFFTNTNSISFSDSNNHSVNTEFDIEVDSTLLINIEPSFRRTKNKTVFSRDSESLDEFNVLTNQSTTESVVETFGNNFSNDLDITKRFGSKGAYLRLSVENEISTREREDFLYSETNIYGDNPNDIIRDQFTEGDNNSNNFDTELSYNLPLTNGLSVDFSYNYRRNKTEDKQSTFDKDINGDYSIFNEDLSTDFEYINEQNSPEISLRYRTDKTYARFRTNYIFRTLENRDLLRTQYSIKRNFEAVELSSYFRHRFSSKSSVYLGYRLNNDPPQLSQLQPFQNVSDPLNTIIGNPNLEPTNNHGFRLGYNAFNPQGGAEFNLNINGNIVNNEIVSKTVVDENFVRETTFANVNGNYNFGSSVEVGKKVKLDTIRTLRYDIGVRANISRRINFNNGIQYAGDVNSISPNINFIFTWKDVMEIRPRYDITLTKNRYDIDSFDNREFLLHTLNINTATFLPKNLEWRNNIIYTYNSNIADGFQKSAWFWNSTLAYSVLKNKGIVTLKAYDLLNQNTNARRIAAQDYIQDSQSTVLQQYFMLSFSWKFNSLGKLGEIDNNDSGYRGRRHYRRR